MSSALIDEARPRPVVVGTGIKVSHLAYGAVVLMMSEAEIRAAHPHVTREQLRAALAYFQKNPERIRAEWEESARLIADAQKRFPSRSLPSSA